MTQWKGTGAVNREERLYYIVVLSSWFTASVPFHWVIVLYCCTLFLIDGFCSFSLGHCIILLYSLLDLRLRSRKSRREYNNIIQWPNEKKQKPSIKKRVQQYNTMIQWKGTEAVNQEEVLSSWFTASVSFHWVIVLYCCPLFLIYGFCSFSLGYCIILLYMKRNRRRKSRREYNNIIQWPNEKEQKP
jgi:hypothetical protein